MIRITKMSGKYYGIEVSDDTEKEMEDIISFVEQGTPVILVNSIDDLEDIGIYDADVIMVGRN